MIGDVHGCREEAEQLLLRGRYTPDDDVVFVGDLVGKGPDSAGMLDLCLRLGARSVLGNHDARLLRALRAKTADDASACAKESQASVVGAFRPCHVAYLESLPLRIDLPQHDAFVVHAGLVPSVAIGAQDPAMLLEIRTLRPDGTGSKSAEDGVLWGEQWPGPELVIFGHHAAAGLQRHSFAIGLDTGCVYGGALTAVVLPERSFVAVPARRVYAPIAGRGA